MTYRDAGVDIDAGNASVSLIKESVRATYRPEVLGDLGGFGGLFALYTLFNQPDAFQTYIASSPSLWWHDEYILQERDRFVQAQAGRPALPVRVHLSIGEYEQKHAPYITPDSPRAQMLKARGQVDRVRAFTRHLNETLPGLPVSFTEHPRSTHGSSQLYAVLDALRFASGTDTV